MTFKGYIYRLDCPITGEFYIGSRKFEGDPLDDNYMGSYSRWKPIDKNILIKNILYVGEFDRRSIHILEGSLIKEYIKDPLNMNCQIPSENTFSMHGIKHTEETIEKMKNQRQSLSEEDRKIRYGKAFRGKNHTDETKNKISEKLKGRNHTDETKDKISSSLTGNKHSEDTRKKMSLSGGNRKGTICTEETKKKMKDTMKDTVNKRHELLLEKLKEIYDLEIPEKDKAAMLNLSYPTYIKLKKILISTNNENL